MKSENNLKVYEVRKYTDWEATRTKLLGYFKTDDVQKIGAFLRSDLDSYYGITVKEIPEPVDVSDLSPFIDGIEISIEKCGGTFVIKGNPTKTREDIIKEVAGKAGMSVDELRALFPLN